jgi:hypothetical protein
MHIVGMLQVVAAISHLNNVNHGEKFKKSVILAMLQIFGEIGRPNRENIVKKDIFSRVTVSLTMLYFLEEKQFCLVNSDKITRFAGNDDKITRFAGKLRITHKLSNKVMIINKKNYIHGSLEEEEILL